MGVARVPALMKTVLILAPNLARFTYACPYLIPAAAVQAGANPIPVRSSMPRFVRAPPRCPTTLTLQ